MLEPPRFFLSCKSIYSLKSTLLLGGMFEVRPLIVQATRLLKSSMELQGTHKGFVIGVHSRGYLPHFEGAEIQMISYRLADALPKEVLAGLIAISDDRKKRETLESTMVAGYGCCCLAILRVAELASSPRSRFGSMIIGIDIFATTFTTKQQ